MHLMEDSDNYDVFSDDEKNEFIYRIFKHLCLGGDICQVTYVIPATVGHISWSISSSFVNKDTVYVFGKQGVVSKFIHVLWSWINPI